MSSPNSNVRDRSAFPAGTVPASQDGESWTFLGQVTMPMTADVFVGLPVTGHSAGTLATAVFDDVVIWHSVR